MDYRAGSLKSQLKRANKLGVSHCLILGEEELKKTIENVCFNNVNEFFGFNVKV